MPAAAQATGPIIRAILIENRDMPALLAVSPVLGNLAGTPAAITPPIGETGLPRFNSFFSIQAASWIVSALGMSPRK
jgi:hypothetical protein